jgi:glycosyltransferase involved in cell wall biosynthesis
MKISIITATWNSGATLRDTMNSVLGQTYTDFEHIIVDGLSSDNTLDIVKEMEPLYGGKLKCISEKDRGIYDAMNKGIAMATGDVIGILNSDDFYTSTDVLQRIVDNMTEEVDAVYGDIHMVKDDDLTRCVRYYSSGGFRKWMFRIGLAPAHPSFYCRSEIYHRLGYYNPTYRISADYECLVRFLYKNQIKAIYIPLDFVTMRTGGASNSGWSSIKTGYKERLRALKSNGINANRILLCLLYPCKYWGVIRSKLNLK